MANDQYQCFKKLFLELMGEPVKGIPPAELEMTIIQEFEDLKFNADSCRAILHNNEWGVAAKKTKDVKTRITDNRNC